MKILDFNGLKLVIDRIKYLIIESVDNHKSDTNIHVSEDEKNKWNNISNVEDKLSNLENQLNSLDKENSANIANMEAKLQQLENAMFEDITGNPFTVTFKNIDGLILTNGVFNENKARLEC